MKDLTMTIGYGAEVDSIVLKGSGLAELMDPTGMTDEQVLDWAKDAIRQAVRTNVTARLIGTAVDQFFNDHVTGQT